MNANQFVAPSGYIELDNDCEFSLDRKSTRSRESVDPKTDLAFYFNTYIVPKYGLDNINVNNYKANAVGSIPIMYSTTNSYVDESRATHPAWTYREIIQNRWETPILDPQYGLEKPFIDNISTRILEKDYLKNSFNI